MLRPRVQYARTTSHYVVVIRRHYTTAKPGTICHIVSREITLIHDINDLPPHFAAANLRYIILLRLVARIQHSPIFSVCDKQDG